MINSRIQNYLTHFEQKLHDLVWAMDIPATQIKEAMLYTLFPGGKRLRPLLVYLTGNIVGLKQNVLDTLAIAIELIHCYSLVHDDLPAMDNDDFRRGKPSCHKAFDEATAILVGDGMQGLAIDVLLRYLPHSLSTTRTISVTQELIHASGVAGMVSGQGLDLYCLTQPTLNETQLRLIHTLKTGKLISACINMVLLASDVCANTSQPLRNYANQLGIVFQMQDDYLDHYATDILGKDRASDDANHKITFTHFYSQTELLELMHQSFQQMADTLAPLEKQADDLLALTTYLSQRIK